MPGGNPKWVSNERIDDEKDFIQLKDLFGFIQAFIVCPDDIDKPFLPYRKKDDGTLIFGTGMFVGVYFSEELKFAEKLGYLVVPICGWVFDRIESPFKDFVNDLYQRRLEAKQKGEKGISFTKPQ
jgi:hypothetical protein